VVADETTWTSFAQLIQLIPRLSDLIFNFPGLFPARLLDALHTFHPNCRLHIADLVLPSLLQPKSDVSGLDQDDFKLATSPCLHSIGVRQFFCSSDGQLNYDRDVLLQMIRGASPNLKHVYVVPGHDDDPHEVRVEYFSSSRPRPTDFFHDGRHEADSRKGELHSFHWDADGNSPAEIDEWFSVIDFSQLHSLNIETIGPFTLEKLISSVAETGLNKLQSLKLRSSSLPWYSESQFRPTASLLHLLQPLSVLKITAQIGEEILMSVLYYHGKTLKQLHLTELQVFNAGQPRVLNDDENMKDLIKFCPNLEDIEFRMRRTLGDKKEVGLYRALGGLRRLRRVSIILDCEIVEKNSTFQHVLSENLTRDMFINAACDEKLATSIFTQIFGTEKSRNNPSQSLELCVIADVIAPSRHSYTRWEIRTITDWIGRAWLVERPFEGNVKVKELNRHDRERHGEDLQADLKEHLGSHGEAYEKVWRSIWPPRTGNWMMEWESLPLWTEDE